MGSAGAEAVTGFAGILGIASIIAIAIDAIARRRFRDREVFFVIAAIGIFILLANVKPAVAAMHAIIGLAANARLRFLFAWILAVLIAAALNRLRTIPFAIGLASAALLIAIVVMRTPFPSDVARHDGLRLDHPERDRARHRRDRARAGIANSRRCCSSPRSSLRCGR